MALVWHFSSLVVFVSAVAGYATAKLPTKTVGYGVPFAQLLPTEAPSMELVKRDLGKRESFEVCSEWTIPGGFGQPECYGDRTCLFTSATDGNLYEDCGETSTSFAWVTECWPWPQIGTPPPSQIYCPETAPSCGFIAFELDDFNTYWNFGCSTVSYSFYAVLVSTSDAGASQTEILAAGGTSSITEVAPVVTETVTETPTSVPAIVLSGLRQGTASTNTGNPPQTEPASSAPTSTNIPISSSNKSSTPIGAIVGGVVGGIVVICGLAFFTWFCLRKRRQDAATTHAHEANQQVQADAATGAAFNNYNRISELGGTMKPMPEHVGAFAPQQQAVYGNVNGNEKVMGQQTNEYPSATAQSPPPIYAQSSNPQQIPIPQQQAPMSQYPSSIYTESDNQTLQSGNARISVTPVSPVGEHNSNASELFGSSTVPYQPSVSPPVVQAYYPPASAQELSVNGGVYQQQPIQQQGYQHPPSAQDVNGNTGLYQQVPITQQQGYELPANVQEMSAYQQQPTPQQQGYQPPPNIHGMSGNAASIRPARQSAGFDMSGAPLSGDYGHHELP